ncbi:hypothetical protein [Streptomyces boninensis]|uniref:hypothetical protein n=1 Tax=Streptomyces boninensis TaxID=2039455 RepID=UPI003B214992
MGREEGALPVLVRVNGSLSDADVAEGERAPLTGSPEQVAENDLPRLVELGVGEAFWSMDDEPVLPDDQLNRMERLIAAAGKTFG